MLTPSVGSTGMCRLLGYLFRPSTPIQGGYFGLIGVKLQVRGIFHQNLPKYSTTRSLIQRNLPIDLFQGAKYSKLWCEKPKFIGILP